MPTHPQWFDVGRASVPLRVQRAAVFVGASLLLVGVCGFVPGITTHYGQLTFANNDSHAALLGVLNVSVMLNLVHVALGAAGFPLARTASAARGYLIGGGVLYLVLSACWAALIEPGPASVPTVTTSGWLQIGVSVGMVGLGFGLEGERS